MDGMRRANPATVIIKMVLVELIWGATFVGGRIVAASLPAMDGAALRFLWAAAGTLFLLFYAKAWRRVQKGDLLVIVLMGLSGIVSYNFFFFGGLQRISASRASMITAGTPIGVMLGAALFLHEKLNLRKILGIALSVAGAMIVISARYESGFAAGKWGEFFMLGCALSWATYTLLARGVLVRVPSMTVTGYSTLAGALVLLLLAAPHTTAGRLAAITWQVWTAAAFIGLFGGALAFKWYMDGVAALGASRASQFNNLIPVFAVAQSMLILRERPSLASIFGGALVIAGLMVAQRSPAPGLNATQSRFSGHVESAIRSGSAQPAAAPEITGRR
jgi:drug/metabolite transporter (DMT)-like permease